MNVLFFIVNFKADDHLLRFIGSVQAAQETCSVCVEMHVLDNSQKTAPELERLRVQLSATGAPVLLHSTGTNEGYLGGLAMAQSLVHEKTDAVIYCNPDLFINSDFFTVLEHTLKTVVGVIAPSILSLRDGFDLNPQYRKKLSRTKLKCLQRIYAYRLFFSSYNALGRIKEVISGWNYWLRRGSKEASATIYAPHGAMFIFTDIGFFRRLPSFPCFLFGEELFVAEEARLAGVPVVYEPALRIHDVRHASVGLLPKEFLRVLCYKSVTFLLNRYYAVPEEK